jgi:purine-binding chemotaxis protein CheW
VRKTVAAVPSLQFVAFRLGSAEFAVDVFAVQEILRLQPILPVPQAPAFVTGVIELRGVLVPVIDLRRRFGVEHPVNEAATRIMIARLNEERVGLIVDAVSEVMRVPETSLGDPPPYIRDVAAEYLRNIVRVSDRLVAVLDLQRVLTAEELIALGELEPLLERARTEALEAGDDPESPVADQPTDR